MKSSEAPKIKPEQEMGLSPEELKRHEEIESVIERIIFENYWKSIDELGQHVIARSVELITSEIHHRYGGDEIEIKKIVLESILKSPSPEDLKPDAVSILADAIRSGEQVVIWTLGDEGDYSDDEKKIYYPAYNMQKRKIDGSNILSELDLELLKFGDNERNAPESVSLSISAKDKREALKDAVIKFEKRGVRHVYVVDDVEENITLITGVSEEVGGPRVHDFRIKKDADEEGNLTACRRYISKRRQEHSLRGENIGLVIDWDNTLYDEPKRVSRSARMIASELMKKVIK
jgi:hypothetical protein